MPSLVDCRLPAAAAKRDASTRRSLAHAARPCELRAEIAAPSVKYNNVAGPIALTPASAYSKAAMGDLTPALVRGRETGLHASVVQRVLRPRLEKLLHSAGVVLDGTQPWDPHVTHPRFFRRIALGGTLGAGESYVDGDWECDALDELTARVLGIGVEQRLGLQWKERLDDLWSRVINPQSRIRAQRDARRHYDRGNRLYHAMLGPTMVYSCGYWREARTLEEAQTAKMDLICRKLRLRRGERLLDIGCGWGSLARFASERYGVDVVGVTLSEPQAEWARQQCAGLPVEIRVQDYRDIDEVFDHVVSVGMFEHVGDRNHAHFFRCVDRCLADEGLFLLHTIGASRSFHAADPWMGTYIFPDALLPSAVQITRAAEGVFVIEDWHNFGADYDRTLLAWARNFEQTWPALRTDYDERFRRMWRYYLLTSAGTFRARHSHLWQIVLSKRGVRGGYLRCGT